MVGGSSEDDCSDIDTPMNTHDDNGVKMSSLTDRDLLRIAQFISMSKDKDNLENPENSAQIGGTSEGISDSNMSTHNNLSHKAVEARQRADALIDSMSGNRAPDNPLEPQVPQNDTPAPSENQKVYQVTADELKLLLEDMNKMKTPEPENKKRKLNQGSDDSLPVDGPALGAFGAIRNRASILAVNRKRGQFADWDDEVLAALHPRLLKSGLNRTYNDLVVHELIWPNDLVLRGSERIQLLEMTPSEFAQAVVKTVLGTLPPLTENRHTENLLHYFSALFRDTRDDAFNITLKAHKTVMGQLEKGGLSLESDWHSWDEVRKHSMLTQTLQSLTSQPNKPRQNSNNGKENNRNAQSSAQTPRINGKNGPQNNTNNSYSKPCSYYNLGKCNRNIDHGDKFHSDDIWLHICNFCFTNRKDKARHSDLECPFKAKDTPKNGERPFRGQ